MFDWLRRLFEKKSSGPQVPDVEIIPRPIKKPRPDPTTSTDEDVFGTSTLSLDKEDVSLDPYDNRRTPKT